MVLKGAPGGVLTPSWEKNMSRVPLQQIATTSSQYVKEKHTVWIMESGVKASCLGKANENMHISPLALSTFIMFSSKSLPYLTMSCDSSWAVRGAGSKQIHGKGPENACVMPGTSEGTRQGQQDSGEKASTKQLALVSKTPEARDRQSLIRIRLLNGDITFGILYSPPLHRNAVLQAGLDSPLWASTETLLPSLVTFAWGGAIWFSVHLSPL